MNEREKEFDEIFKEIGGIASDEVYNSPIFLIALSYAKNLIRQLEEQSWMLKRLSIKFLVKV